MKSVRKIIKIDEEKCNGCGQCVLACAEGALALIDGKAKVLSDNLCDGLGACIGECPQDALHIIEREAEAFDEEAVESHLTASRDRAQSPVHAKAAHAEPVQTMPCGCPSARVESFTPCAQANRPLSHKHQASDKSGQASALSHWPVQIRLIPPTAPFLKGADLLVVADCVPVAYPALHQEFMQGRVVMLGCPKFDDGQAYVDKFTEIFRVAGIKSVTVMSMEVPCCAGLPRIVGQALRNSGAPIPFDQVVIGTRGQILDNPM